MLCNVSIRCRAFKVVICSSRYGCLTSVQCESDGILYSNKIGSSMMVFMSGRVLGKMI